MADDIVAPADIVAFLDRQLDNPTKTVHTTPGWAKAVRAILELHAPTWPDGKPLYEERTVILGGQAVHIDDDTRPIPPFWCSNCELPAPCQTVLLLAAPFTGEPGWDPSWTLDA